MHLEMRADFIFIDKSNKFTEFRAGHKVQGWTVHGQTVHQHNLEHKHKHKHTHTDA